MSTLLRSSIANLGKYFDLSTGEDPSTATADTAVTNAEAFLGIHTSLPSLTSLKGLEVGESADDPAKVKFKVTPYESFPEAGADLLTAPYDGSKNLQGAYKPKSGANYTVRSDLVTADQVPDGVSPTPLHVIQNFDTFSTISSNDTPIVSFLMNGVPSVEWSRSAVLLDVSVRTTKGAQPISSAFLNRMQSFDNTRDAAQEPDAATADGPFPLGSMDIFTMPQTLVNLQRESLQASGVTQDPFRPLVSIIDFKTEMSGFISRGTMGQRAPLLKEKKATLRLLCHNQSYLNTLSPLVRPDRRGETLIVVTYGWSHPDGARLGRPSDAQKNNDVGIVIDHCRITEAYTILDCRITLNEAGEASVDLELSFTSVGAALVDSTIGSSSDTATGTELKREVAGMIDLFGMNNQGRQKSDFHVSSFLRKIKNDAIFTSASKDALKAYRKAVENAIKDQRFDPTKTKKGAVQVNSAGLTELKKLFEDFFGEKNSAAFLKAAAASNPNSTVNGMINILKSTPDPFLREANKNNPASKKGCPSKRQMNATKRAAASNPEFVSFGKVITCFLGPVLMTLPSYSEVQIIFHGFNDSSGAIHTFNIAQFPIKLTTLRSFLKDLVKSQGQVSCGTFINRLANKFIHDGGSSQAFGFAGLKSLEAIDKRLYEIYDIKSQTQIEFEKTTLSPQFVQPRISMITQSAPMRSELNPTSGISKSTEGGGTVLRVHIVDEEFSANKIYREALNAAQTTGVFPQRPRNKTDDLTSVNHAKLDDKAIKFLSSADASEIIKVFEDPATVDGEPNATQKLIDDVEAAFASGDTDSDVTTDVPGAVKNMIKEYHFVNDSSVSTAGDEIELLKKLSRQELPGFIIVGCEGTAVVSANVQTTQDPRVVNLALLDTRTPEQKEADEKSGRMVMTMSVLPVEVDLTVLGCPFLHPGQEYLIDLNTGTNLDQFYRILRVSHEISQGKFITTLKCAPSQAGPRYQSPKGNIGSFITSRIRALGSSS